MTHTAQYNYIPGVESLERYTPGGYHPVNIGDTFRDRYRVVDKLGFGGYSTVWLVRDTVLGRYSALKVGIADSRLPDSEIRVLHALASPSAGLQQPGRALLPCILDEFEHDGPNGRHPCYVTTPARGDLRQAKERGMFPLEVSRALSGGLATAVAYMHSHGYVHGDIHLGNILVRLPSSFDGLSIERFYEEYGKPETVPITRLDGGELPCNVPTHAVVPIDLGIPARQFKLADARPILSDLGESFSPASGEIRLGEDCHTPLPVRPPESLLAPDAALSYSSDVWQLALAIWDIVSMKSLFSHDFATEDEMISQHVDLLGRLPHPWREKWSPQEDRFFGKDGQRRNVREMLWPSLEVAFEEGVQKYRRKLGVGAMDEEERVAFLALMRQMLVFRPEERISAEQVLGADWMVRWALPDFERSEMRLDP
ncbi:hypothetical protein VTK73DRAFT_7596 [Phialemonium thermophilum]|uniref:non-specific serine/threonine protein kinase n=1 Tax=Phialemonium thermophilum TaxID=223376 RepID=A0ABR3WDA2_9PEZI